MEAGSGALSIITGSNFQFNCFLPNWVGTGKSGSARCAQVSFYIEIIDTRMMFIKHYAPNRCLCIKVANSIDHWVEDCKGRGRGDMYKEWKL